MYWITRHLFVVCLLLSAVPVHAASLTVKTVDRDGVALSDVALALFPLGREAPTRPPETVEIVQRDKTFIPLMTAIRTGDAVRFPNQDTVRHHVYSFSAPRTFELKLYLGTPPAPVVFDKPGVVVLGCNIHDHMVAYVVVSDTVWNTVTGPDGVARFEGVPDGEYAVQSFRVGQIDSAALPRKLLRVEGDAQVVLTLEAEGR